MIKKLPSKEMDNYRHILCIRVCDECGREDKVKFFTIKIARDRRKKDIDLCQHCASTRKYKTMPRGPEYKQWKHGLNCGGYRLVTTCAGRKCFEHELVYEKFLGRRLTAAETTHHIDMVKTNNILDNLFLFANRSDHMKCHHGMEKCGFSFLNSKIWYDANTKQYILSKPKNMSSNIEVKSHIIDKFAKYKKYLITPKNGTRQYYSHSVKLLNGKWTSKIFHTSLVKEIIGRDLFRNECVHHIDGDALNNDISNLFLMTLSEHGGCHASIQRCVASLYKEGLIKFEDGKYFSTTEKN